MSDSETGGARHRLSYERLRKLVPFAGVGGASPVPAVPGRVEGRLGDARPRRSAPASRLPDRGLPRILGRRRSPLRLRAPEAWSEPEWGA